MADRWYQQSFPHRPVYKNDLGSMIKIDGIVMGGCGAGMILLLPNADPKIVRPIHQMTEEEVADLIARTDNPEILVSGSPEKVFQRKLRYDVSGHVQQKIWAADGFKCMFCFRAMGSVQLSIDHFMPLELGGVNDQSNYLSACRKCNKDKGCMDPRVFIDQRGLDATGYTYQWYLDYLKNRKV